MTLKLNYFYPLLILSIFTLLAGCIDPKTDHSPKIKYSIYTMTADGREYIVRTDSITSGTINAEKEGVKVTPPKQHYDLIVQGNYYFRIDARTGEFVKSEIKNGILSEVKSIPLKGFSSMENYNWIHSDSLLLFCFDPKAKVVRSAKIEVNKMTSVQEIVPIPAPFGNYNSLSIGFSKFMDRKLLIGYTYHKIKNLGNYETSDTMYVASFTYPSLQSLTISKDTRSTYPGGVNSRQPHSFTDEKGDFYFIACPGIAAGNTPDKPTGIFRIKNGEDRIDPDYCFNISTSPIQNHGYGLWYIGQGKAIVRTERKDLFTGMKDHYKVPHFDFYEVDLATQVSTRLALPLDKGTFRQCILVENGLVYITINSQTEGNYIWIFNPKTKSLKKGLKFSDNTDYILRLERLN